MLRRHRLDVDATHCLRLRHHKSSCRLCLDNCPTGALRFAESLLVDDSLCHSCGACVNLCPTEVFSLRGLAYDSLLAEAPKDDELEFTCSSAERGKSSLQVPCLGYLNEAFLVGAVIRGRTGIKLDIGRCAECSLAPVLPAIHESIRRTKRILDIFGMPMTVSASAVCGGPSPEDGHSRREFFSFFLKKPQPAAETDGADSEPRTAPKRVTLQPRLPRKRSLLLEQIRAMSSSATRSSTAECPPFAQVKIGAACSGCGFCVTFCPTGALSSRDTGDTTVIEFDLSLCLACGLCSDICPEEAIACHPHISLLHLVTPQKVVLAERRKSTCPQCGQSFVAPFGGSLCPECSRKRALEKLVTRIW